MARSLYREYRPKTFDEVVGQEHVVKTLEHAIKEAQVSHAYLFTGPRGTGKTTMARLLAKALLCTDTTSKLPDGTCEACKKVAEGVHPDVYELDAASRTGVDSVREEIISRVVFAPTEANYKVYIIDEVHMLTTAAFNALLKTLEEPPSHVVFVLCTTDVHKVPETILSRCQRFDFHRISDEDLESHLAYICEKEGFDADKEALELIARQSKGGMRDALSMLEQLSVFGNDSIKIEDARSILGQIESASLSKIIQYLGERDVAAAFAWVNDFVEQGTDLLQLVTDLISYVRNLYVLSVTGADQDVLGLSEEKTKELYNQAQAFGGKDRLSYTLAELGETARDMRLAQDQRLCVELAFTKIARPSTELTLESLAARVEDLERLIASAPVRKALSNTQSKEMPSEPKMEASVPQEPKQTSTQEPKQAPDQKSTPQPTQKPVQKPVQKEQVKRGNLNRMWEDVIALIKAKKPSRAALLQNSFAQSIDGNVLSVELPAGADFSLKMLARDDVKEVVDSAIEEIFGHPLTTRYCTGFACETEPETKSQKESAAPPTKKDNNTQQKQSAEESREKIKVEINEEAVEQSDDDAPDVEDIAELLEQSFGDGVIIHEEEPK